MKRVHPGVVWLSITALVLVAVYIYRWRRRSLFCAKWMRVSTVDENGNQIGSRWHLIPKPDKINRNGLSHVARYMTRLVNSPNPKCSLIISSLDGNTACLIMRDGGQVMLKAHVMLGSTSRKKGYKVLDVPPHAPEFEKEATLRKLFAEIGIAPTSDFVHDYNGYTDAMRNLDYPLGNDVSQTNLIVQRVLKEVHHINEADGLDFNFEE